MIIENLKEVIASFVLDDCKGDIDMLDVIHKPINGPGLPCKTVK